MNGAAAQAPKDYYFGFNYILDRQSIGNLIALAQQAVTLNAKSVTICMTSSGGASDQGLYAFEIPHRRLRAEQGRAASGALDGRAPGLGARVQELRKSSSPRSSSLTERCKVARGGSVGME